MGIRTKHRNEKCIFVFFLIFMASELFGAKIEEPKYKYKYKYKYIYIYKN